MQTIMRVTVAVQVLVLLFINSSSAIAPADPDLIPEGRAILNYFESIYQTRTIAAQRRNDLADKIDSCAGKTPAIIEQDLCGWNKDRWGDLYKKNIQSSIESMKTIYYDKKAIPAMCFHWPNPLTEGGRFPDSQEDLLEGQFEKLVTEGTDEYSIMIEDLNKHLDYLQQLTDLDIPVLWRPLHEIDGGWFWWTDSAYTVRLWHILFDHIVNVRQMHNLIWIYCMGEGNVDKKTLDYRKKFYPGAAYTDIVGIDLYHWDYEKGTRTFWNGTVSYMDMKNIVEQVCPGKMIALTECEAIPNMELTAQGDETFFPWLYALPWYAAGNKLNPCEWIQKTVPHSYMITAEQLPNFTTSIHSPLTMERTAPQYQRVTRTVISIDHRRVSHGTDRSLMVNGRVVDPHKKNRSNGIGIYTE